MYSHFDKFYLLLVNSPLRVREKDLPAARLRLTTFRKPFALSH